MINDFFRGEEITIVRQLPTGKDKFGNVTKNSVELPPIEGVVAFRNTSRLVDPNMVVAEVELKIIFDYNPGLFEDDKFLIRGMLWQQDGVDWSHSPDLIVGGFLPSPTVVNIKKVMGT